MTSPEELAAIDQKWPIAMAGCDLLIEQTRSQLTPVADRIAVAFALASRINSLHADRETIALLAAAAVVTAADRRWR